MWVAKATKFLGGSFLVIEHRQLDMILVLSGAVPASVNVNVIVIFECEKGFLGKACHSYLVLEGSS